MDIESIEVDVDSLTFSFPPWYKVIKYDDQCSFYKNDLSSSFQLACECLLCPSHACSKQCRSYCECPHKKKNSGLKAVDLIAYDEFANRLFFIESKDCRKNPDLLDSKVRHIVSSVVKKFRDTLFGVWCGSILESDNSIRSFLEKCRQVNSEIVFVCHFESPPPLYPSGLFRNPANPNSPDRAIALQTIAHNLCTIMRPLAKYVCVTNMDTVEKNDRCGWVVRDKL